ncbi:MAG: hypothetical protein Q7S43_02805 [bacterium]|nr:hypothetical protein [bacterium]MDO8496359.1 hypothetical protein [bacterium]
MPRKTKEKPIKFTYHYIEPKTPEEKAEAERRVSSAFDILFDHTHLQMAFDDALKEAQPLFKLDINGVHGISHWRRVKEIGLHLASETGADKHVVALFSALHDIFRQDEYGDPEHGIRAAEFVKTFSPKGLLSVNNNQLKQLEYACRYHSVRDARSNDLTIQTCWDADRLDLYRLGEVPDDKYLYGDKAKKRETRNFVLKLLDK